jgi:hypothetical protein
MVEGQSVSPAQVQTAIRGHRVCRGLHGGGSISESNPGTHSHSRPQNMQRPVWWTVNLRVQSRYRQPFEATKFAESCMVEGQSVSPAQVQTAIRGHRICRGLHGGGSICESSPGTDSHSRPQNLQRPANLHGGGSICESSPGNQCQPMF